MKLQYLFSLQITEKRYCRMTGAGGQQILCSLLIKYNLPKKFFTLILGVQKGVVAHTHSHNRIFSTPRQIGLNYQITNILFSISYEREQVVDFSMPFLDLGISILYVASPEKSIDFFSFLAPLSTGVWLLMLAGGIRTNIVKLN